MNDLAWIVGRSFRSLTWRRVDWLLDLDGDIHLAIGCLWRLVEEGRIRVASEDHGQWFGLPSPVDAAEEVNRRLAGRSVEAIDLREGLLDLELRFDRGSMLQILPDSSGYEAWNLCHGSDQFIAVGGGELAVFLGRHSDGEPTGQ